MTGMTARQDRGTGARTDQGERDDELLPSHLPKLPKLAVIAYQMGKSDSRSRAGVIELEGKQACDPGPFWRRIMDQAIGIIGQAVLVVMGLVLLAFLLLILFALIRAMRRVLRDIRGPLLPESDFLIPEPFDQP
jgi:hypothetical protein